MFYVKLLAQGPISGTVYLQVPFWLMWTQLTGFKLGESSKGSLVVNSEATHSSRHTSTYLGSLSRFGVTQK